MDYTPINLNDPIWNYRKGTSDDPYISITENVTITRNVAVLRERPDEATGVTIAGFTPITKEEFETIKTLTTNQFFVDYTSNFIYFNPLINGQTLTIIYKGTGYILIDARRVILQSPNPYAVDNLQEYVDYITGMISTYNSKLDGASTTIQNMLQDFTTTMTNDLTNYENLLNEKMSLIQDEFAENYKTYIDYVDAELQRNIAYMNQKKQQFIDYINSYMKLADEKIAEINRDISLCLAATNDCILSTEACNSATANCISETKTCKEVYNNTLVNYLPYVQQYSDIPYKYPFPENGWTVATALDDIVYRFSDVSNTWEQKRKFESIIPPASDTINGLMSKTNFTKLGGIEDGAQKRHVGTALKNDLPDDVRTRQLVFFVSGSVKAGIHQQIEQFPFGGQLMGIKAFCSGAGNDYLDLSLEKISESNFETSISWTDMLINRVIIPANKKVSNSNYQFTNTQVDANDYFRINIHYSNETVYGLTIQVSIKF